MPAFAAAKSWGATTIEIDIVLTAEGEPIVLHDRILDRTTNGHGFAADLGLAQIRSLDAGAGFDARLPERGFRLLPKLSIGRGARRWGSLSRSRRPSGRTSASTGWPK